MASTPLRATFSSTWVSWSGSKANEGTAASTRVSSSTSRARAGSSRIRAATCVDHFANVAGQALGLAGAGEDQEVGEDPVEAAGLLADGVQGARPLLGGEHLVAVEQGGGVHDGGQRVADLVGHAGGQLPGGGQALRLAQALPQLRLLGDVGHQLEQEDLAVGLADRRAAQQEAAAPDAVDLEPHRLLDRVAALERTALARPCVGREDLVAAAAGHRDRTARASSGWRGGWRSRRPPAPGPRPGRRPAARSVLSASASRCARGRGP